MIPRQPDDPGLSPEDIAARKAESRRGLIVLCVLASAAIIALVMVLASPAKAHDAPTGWSYPAVCCSGVDCREVGDRWTPDADIRIFETGAGYVVSVTGEVIPYNDRRVKASPDGRFHLCCRGAKFATCDVLCLFAPPRAF